MKRHIWLGIAGLAVAAVAVSLIALPKGPEWTTASPAALEEYELAVDAMMKLYHNDAVEHLERALELDPDFVMAKLSLAQRSGYRDPELKEQLMDEVGEADLEPLTPRERLLVERSKAFRDKRYTEANQILAEYLEANPRDPHVLDAAASEAWNRGDYEKAERLYRRLVELSPNWVLAYNQLGYITMLQGRFAEAEEYFTSYRFIAPDQANPHDSLGELYIIQGRYDDAASSLESAIGIKPDFWNSYDHLAFALTMTSDFDAAHAVVDRGVTEQGLPDDYATGMHCWITFSQLDREEAWQEVLDAGDGGCMEASEGSGYVAIVTHMAAAHLGRWDMVQKIEDDVVEGLQKAKEKGASKKFDEFWVLLRHMQGVRQALQGDLEAAERSFGEADGQLTYIGAPQGVFKLLNRMILVETMLAQGKDAEAHKLLSQVRAVNPVFVAVFEDAGLKVIGLDRG